MRTPLHSSFSCLHQPCVRRRSFIAHTRKRLAFIVALACTMLAPALHLSSLIVAHARKRLALIHALMLENVLRSSSIIVAQAGHSSTLKLENALRSSSLLLATALHSRPSSAYIGAHAIMRLALIHALMLMLDARDALRSSWLMLAIALRSSFLMLATALRSSSLIVAHARNRLRALCSSSACRPRRPR